MIILELPKNEAGIYKFNEGIWKIYSTDYIDVYYWFIIFLHVS